MLVVEDEYLIALAVEQMLADAGCLVVGPYARVGEAIAAAEVEKIDVALLDVNVAGDSVFPLAYFLEERGTPFLFVTGYGQAILPPDRPRWEAYDKPFQTELLVERLAQRIGAA